MGPGSEASIISRRPDGHAGFTLVEVLVSISIIAIVLLAVFKLHSQTIDMRRGSGFYSLAPLLARDKLTEIEIEAAYDQAEDSGRFEAEYDGYSWQSRISEVESETLGVLAERLQQIDITVISNREDLSYRLRTYRLVIE